MEKIQRRRRLPRIKSRPGGGSYRRKKGHYTLAGGPGGSRRTGERHLSARISKKKGEGGKRNNIIYPGEKTVNPHSALGPLQTFTNKAEINKERRRERA